MNTAPNYADAPGRPGIHAHSVGPDNVMGRYVIWRDPAPREDGTTGGLAWSSADDAETAGRMVDDLDAQDGHHYGFSLSWRTPKLAPDWTPAPVECTDDARVFLRRETAVNKVGIAVPSLTINQAYAVVDALIASGHIK
jgi:hypothetical protein